MSNDDDSLDPGLVPDVDDEPTPAEKAKARAFGDLVDKVVAGRAPAAMSADDRALTDVAMVIRAAHGLVDLAPARKAALIEGALRQAIETPRGRETVPPSGRPEPTKPVERVEPAAPVGSPVVSIEERRLRRHAPWIVAGVSTVVAAAAVIALAIRTPRTSPVPAAPAAPELAEHLRSRPADALVGVIPQERAADAANRMDAIYADRLDAYRELALGGR